MKGPWPGPRARQPRPGRLALAATVALAAFGLVALAGCSQRPASTQPLARSLVAARIGLEQATHALSGPAFVPQELADARVAMDRVALSEADKQTIGRDLARLTWRTGWQPVDLRACPMGAFCRYYDGDKPCGPWLVAFVREAGRRSACWQLTAFRKTNGRLEAQTFGTLPRAPRLLGAAADGERDQARGRQALPDQPESQPVPREVETVFPAPAERFPWPVTPSASGEAKERKRD